MGTKSFFETTWRLQYFGDTKLFEDLKFLKFFGDLRFWVFLEVLHFDIFEGDLEGRLEANLGGLLSLFVLV